eukprot:TRINITY_DN6151_c0_g2_i1.p1 TRINITY_DN6151_c0_g2~~TRINITY_DN6151_c0_g2_i1.p1  ORF type:complete len:1040 (+),score=194.86 TRINITY_DN6151_c0_g2_i1:159-3278(+)
MKGYLFTFAIPPELQKKKKKKKKKKKNNPKKMGCGGSTNAKPEHGEEPAKGEKKETTVPTEEVPQKVSEPERGFSFGDKADDGTGQDAKTEKEDMLRRRTTIRRRGVSQEVDSIGEHRYVDIPKTTDQINRLKETLTKNPLFSSLRQADLQTVIAAMVEERFEDGVNILTQNEDSTGKYYIVSEGKVDIIKGSETVATFGPGQGFGELELMYSTTCVATVCAKQPTTCFSLGRTTFKVIVMQVQIERQKEYKELLNSVGFLSTLTEYQKSTLADALELCHYKSGDKLIKFGSEGEWMHIISSGTVKVMGKKNDHLSEVATFTRGASVGELEFLHGHKCVADVVAEGDVTSLRLHKAHFEMCMGSVKSFLTDKAKESSYDYYNENVTTNEDGTVKFVQGFAFGDADEKESTECESPAATPKEIKRKTTDGLRRVAVSDNNPVDSNYVPVVVDKTDSDRELLFSVVNMHSLFKSLHDTERSVIVDVMAREEFEEDQIILKQGETGQFLFIITQGDALVTRNEETICVLTKGESIGELELMYDQPCRATVRAKSGKLVAWKIERNTYKAVVMRGVTKRREEVIELLNGVDLLANTAPDRRMMIADALTEDHYTKGDKLLAHGETPDWMHIILKGTVDVIGRDENGKEIFVCSFSKGSVVGELEFLNKHATVADVVATSEEVVTGKLHRTHFERVLGSISDLLKEKADSTEYTYYKNKFDDFAFGDSATADTNSETLSDTPKSTIPQPPAAKRGAVSAEVHEDDDFTPVVIEKQESERKTIEAVLGKNILFSALKGNSEAMQVVVDAMEKVVYPKDTQVMVQNDVGGEHWYIIETGEVDIVKDSVKVTSFKSGEGFGEMELMYACRTAASVIVSSEECTCWRLGRGTYRHIVMKASQSKRELCKKSLAAVPFLKSMTPWQQDHLADALSPCTFGKGETLLKKGDTPSCLHIIVTGTAKVIGETESHEEEEVCVLSSGELIGDLEFLNQHDAVADVVATSELSTLKLTQEHFEICLGPVKNFLQENSLTEKYKYYQSKLAGQSL